MPFLTRRFGPIEMPEENIIRFHEGIPGLECMKRCILIKDEQTLPFYWLQSAEDGNIALPVIIPFIIDATYSPSVDDSEYDALQLENEEDLLVVNVAVIPEDIAMMTANMAAPVLINIRKNIGKQIILQNSSYQIRQPIFDAVCRSLKEEQGCVGTDQKGK